jgi:hypothetical protein
MAAYTYPSWTPADLAKFLDKRARAFPEKEYPLHRRLALDERMREVWEWWDEHVRPNLSRYQGGTSVDFSMKVELATWMPGKPGDMPPKKRAQYFDSVRHHAEALISLLSDTRFDCAWDGATKLDREQEGVEGEIAKLVLAAQRHVDDCDRPGDYIPVAYGATDEGLYELPWDYPHSHLIEILHEVCAWTREDDNWGRGGHVSSSTIRQTGPNARVIRFNCKLYEQFAIFGIEIPFPILATLANVALDLPPDRQMDEDAVRKQVRRHLDRKDHAGSRHS